MATRVRSARLSESQWVCKVCDMPNSSGHVYCNRCFNHKGSKQLSFDLESEAPARRDGTPTQSAGRTSRHSKDRNVSEGAPSNKCGKRKVGRPKSQSKKRPRKVKRCGRSKSVKRIPRVSRRGLIRSRKRKLLSVRTRDIRRRALADSSHVPDRESALIDLEFCSRISAKICAVKSPFALPASEFSCDNLASFLGAEPSSVESSHANAGNASTEVPPSPHAEVATSVSPENVIVPEEMEDDAREHVVVVEEPQSGEPQKEDIQPVDISQDASFRDEMWKEVDAVSEDLANTIAAAASFDEEMLNTSTTSTVSSDLEVDWESSELQSSMERQPKEVAIADHNHVADLVPAVTVPPVLVQDADSSGGLVSVAAELETKEPADVFCTPAKPQRALLKPGILKSPSMTDPSAGRTDLSARQPRVSWGNNQEFPIFKVGEPLKLAAIPPYRKKSPSTPASRFRDTRDYAYRGEGKRPLF